MDIVKCQAALKAAELGSFTAVADVLGYTQSGVTRMVSSLEDELGFPLFYRQKKGVTLTENGQLILPQLRQLVQSYQILEEQSADIKGVIQGAVTIGSYFSVSAIWMPQILKAFKRQYPLIKVTMLEGGNKDIARWLADKSVDFCFCAKPDSSMDCDWQDLHQDPLVAWLPLEHPKAHAKSFAIKDLEKEAFIHTLPDQDTDQDRLIKEEKLKLHTQLTTKDGFTTYQMVAAGLGVSFNQSMISQEWPETIAQVPLKPARYVHLGLASPRGGMVSPAARRFMTCIKEELPRLINKTS